MVGAWKSYKEKLHAAQRDLDYHRSKLCISPEISVFSGGSSTTYLASKHGATDNLLAVVSGALCIYQLRGYLIYNKSILYTFPDIYRVYLADKIASLALQFRFASP